MRKFDENTSRVYSPPILIELRFEPAEPSRVVVNFFGEHGFTTFAGFPTLESSVNPRDTA